MNEPAGTGSRYETGDDGIEDDEIYLEKVVFTFSIPDGLVIYAAERSPPSISNILYIII